MAVTNCTSVCHLNVPVLDGHDEEVDKPGEGVLVHGVDVGQVCQGEEEDGGVACNGAVTHAGRLNLLLFPVCLPDGPLLLLVEGGGLWMPCMGLQPLVPCHGWVIWGHELPCSAILVLAVWQVARWSVVASGS